MRSSTKASFRFMAAGAAAVALVAGCALGATPASADLTPHTLTAGHTLKSNTSIRSLGQQYYLLMQDDGNLVEFLAGERVWQSHTAGNPGATLVMQKDGNAVVYSTAHKALWASGTARAGDAQGEIGVGTDGNLWVKDSHENVVWQNHAPGTNVLARTGAGTFFSQGWYLHSGDAKMILQTDGNLVVYKAGQAVWSTGTRGNDFVELQTDGNLVVSSAAPFRDLWSTQTAGTGPDNRLQLGMDGRLTLFSGSRIVWQS